MKCVSEWKLEFANIRGGWKIQLSEEAKPYREIIKHSKNTIEVNRAEEELSKLRKQYVDTYGDWDALTPKQLADSAREWERIQIAKPTSFRPKPESGEAVFQGPMNELIDDLIKGTRAPEQNLFSETLIGKFSLTQNHIEPKTLDQRISALKEMGKFFSSSKSQLTTVLVKQYVESIEKQSQSTKRRKLSSGKIYFNFLKEEGIIRESVENPFKNVEIRVNRKESIRNKRKEFKKSDIERLYKLAISNQDAALANTILISAYTGMRIEEVCRLKKIDCYDDQFCVTDSKTKAGHRSVPIHKRIRFHIEELCRTSKDGYLIESSSKNKYGKRSDPISKRFATLKKNLNFGKEHVFHSIRRSVATFFENSGIPESVAADIMGHEKPTMTYGLYSGGSSMEQMRSAIEQSLHYDFSRQNP